MSATPKAEQIEASGEERTFAQTIYLLRAILDQQRAVLDKRLPATYATYRKIRKHPTVAMTRALTIAPIVAGEWNVEADSDAPPGAADFIRTQLFPIREPLLQTALEHGCDYGWSPWEKVFDIEQTAFGQRVVLRKIKPLLVDITEIIVEQQHGNFSGFRQRAQFGAGGYLELELPYSLLINFRVEGAHHYGTPLLENVRFTYAAWEDANAGAERYDKKVAGDHWVVYYPIGSTPVNGVETDNAQIARDVIATLEASGVVVLPRKVASFVKDLAVETGQAWDVQLKSASGQQGNFVSRLDYCDKMFVRGLLTPERTVLEGTFGTKAEAGVHAGLAITQRELEHRHVTRLVNWHLVDQLLALNWGEQARGKVRLVAAPLVDAKLAFYQAVFQAMLSNPLAAGQALERLDAEGLMEAIGLPMLRSTADESMTPVQRELADRLATLYRKVNGPSAA